MRLLRDLELSRKDSFEQLRKEKEQSDLRIQQHIQRLEAKDQEREAKKRWHFRRKPSQEKQTPKIPKFYGGSDPKIFLDWEAKFDQIFNENYVKDQAQVDLVLLGFWSMPILGGINFVRIMTKGHPRLLGWTLKLLCALDLFLPPIGRNFF